MRFDIVKPIKRNKQTNILFAEVEIEQREREKKIEKRELQEKKTSKKKEKKKIV